MGLGALLLKVPGLLDGGNTPTLEQYATSLGLAFWIQADLGDIALLNDSDAVATWDDQSANSLDLTQGNVSFRPVYNKNVVNGLPAVTFDGTNKTLAKSSVSGSTILSTSAGTCFIALKQASDQANNYAFQWRGASAERYAVLATYSNIIYYDHGSYTGGGRISVAQPTGWDDAWHILELHRDGAPGTITVDGSQLTSANFTDDLDLEQSIAITLSDSTYPFKGQIYGVWLSKTALSPTQRLTFRTLLSRRLGF